MKKTTIGLLLGLLVMGIVATSAYAFSGHFGKGFMGNDVAEDALANSDYDAFISAVTQARDETDPAKLITEEKFNEMAQVYDLKEAVNTALESKDYDAWLVAQTNLEKAQSITSKITEENFADYAAMHEAMQNQNFEEARGFAEKLGFGMGHGKMHRMGRP